MTDLFGYKRSLEEKVEEQTDALRKTYEELSRQSERLHKMNQEVINVLGTVVEYRNLESGEHVQRVKGYTRIMAEQAMADYPEYGLTRDKIELIVSASALHDIGKIAIPDSILLKPGRLTKDEFEQIKLHTVKGSEILDSLEGEWDESFRVVSREICRHHHERYDGKGYPDKLAGEAIPVSAQLVSVADVYDALVNKRCYKDAYSTEEAFNMIMNGECGTFSPRLLDIFKRVRPKFEELARSEK